MNQLDEDHTYVWTEEVPEGTMKTTFTVEENNTYPSTPDKDKPPHYWCTINKITVDGEDKTDEYIQKAFSGERERGIPLNKVEEMKDLQEVEQ
jgi:hypothetical protein